MKSLLRNIAFVVVVLPFFGFLLLACGLYMLQANVVENIIAGWREERDHPL